MHILIYRNPSGEIRNITNCEYYFKRGMTLKKIKEAIPAFNNKNPNHMVSLRKVSKMDEDFLCTLIPDDVELMTSSILHDVGDDVKDNRYIYEFVKCEGRDFPIIRVMKILSKGDHRIAELRHDKGELPFAWCYAKDLLDTLGISKSAMNEMLFKAKGQAWGWYDEANNHE